MSIQLALPDASGALSTSGSIAVENPICEPFSVATFSTNFEALVDAAGGTSNLRRLVLSLAFRGALFAEGAASRSVLPPTWKRTQLGELASVITKGTTPTSVGFQFQNSGIRFVKTENVKRGSIQIKTITDFISDEANEALSRSQLQEGDVLFSIAGTIGETCVVQRGDLPANTNQALAIIRGTGSVLLAEFLRRQLDSFVSEAIKERARGGAMNNVSLGDLRVLEVVVPPLAEQKRIVARVDQLMALIDELEAKQTKKRDLSTRFTKASLEALTSAESPADFDTAWKRVVENFSTAIDRAEQVGDLKSSVIEIAVQGMLSTSSEQTLMTVGDVVQSMQNGLYKHAKYRSESGVAYVRMYNIQDGHLDLSELQRLEVTPEERAKYALRVGDVLINRVNSRELVGKSALVGSCPEPMVYEAMNIRLRPDNALVRPAYLNLVLRSPSTRLRLIDDSKQAVGQASVNQTEIARVPIRLPSLSEQDSIVAKVDQLMKLCDDLEAKLRRSEDRASKLVEAVVQEIVTW